MKTPFHRRCMEVARSRLAPGKVYESHTLRRTERVNKIKKKNVWNSYQARELQVWTIFVLVFGQNKSIHMRNEMLIEPTGNSEKIQAPDVIRTHDPP